MNTGYLALAEYGEIGVFSNGFIIISILEKIMWKVLSAKSLFNVFHQFMSCDLKMNVLC